MDRKGPVPSGYDPGRTPAALNVIQLELSRPRSLCLAWILMDLDHNAPESEYKPLLYSYVPRHLLKKTVTGFEPNIRDTHLSRYMGVKNVNP